MNRTHCLHYLVETNEQIGVHHGLVLSKSHWIDVILFTMKELQSLSIIFQ